MVTHNIAHNGRMYTQYQQDIVGAHGDNPYAPFASKLDWEVARWAKLRGSGSTAFTDLLTIQGLAEKLSLSYRNTHELNKKVDSLPAGRPCFERDEIVVAGEAFEVYFRDILECIRALLGDPEFAPLLLLVPEKHYVDTEQKVRIYFDLNTGKWWWATQEALEKEQPGATVIPVIISSDKTQLTMVGNKSAYPPSRRGQILLAYLPTTRLLHIPNKASRRRTLANLFHACMTRVLEPLASVGVSGMPFAAGDGTVRRGHPILAVYVGDYPEQVLVTGCKTVPREGIGSSPDSSRPLRDLGKILDALAAIDQGSLTFTRACAEAGIKPLHHPFWEDLPYTNIHMAITPDILHQLYQGVLKHLIAWLQTAYGADEIDARCHRLPPNHSLRHFSKGISTLSQVTGKEHQDIARIILGLIIGMQLPGGVSSAPLLDFLYLAQTLQLLDGALLAFHANKSIFVDLGIREHFKLPKLHALEHYRRSIELFGTTDNYDTQYSERLHIDFTKDAYRATNHKDEFAQMTLWLERKEKIQRHENPLERQYQRIQMARHPTVKAVPFSVAMSAYGATYIRDALARFIVSANNPTLSPAQVELACGSIYLNFRTIPVYHKIKFVLQDFEDLGVVHSETHDAIHARPARKNKYHSEIPARFDTVLVRANDPPDHTAIQGYHIGQVRLVFTIPEKAKASLFPRLNAHDLPQHLAYIEWFAPSTPAANPDHGLYKLSRSVRRGSRLCSVIPITQIERSCHLFPDFGAVAPREWTSSNVLERCNSFYLNTFSDRYMYSLIQ
ncbi:hypothetical protein BD413DRAFT_606037 [Trametes elegans]|nr:hypothetical protein BD413DRAFT_606037 [Trametes elegans]